VPMPDGSPSRAVAAPTSRDDTPAVNALNTRAPSRRARGGRPELATLMQEVANAQVVLGEPLAWLADPATSDIPVAVECWVFDPSFAHVILVHHRWRGWVAPGGAVEPGELPRTAAVRELREETGLTVDLELTPVMACLRSYRADWDATLALTYTSVTSEEALIGEPGQPCRWTPLAETWPGSFPEDRARIRQHIAEVAGRTGTQ